jgi:hypothetical protein
VQTRAGVATVGSIVQVRVVDTTAQTPDLATDGADAATAASAKSAPVQAPASIAPGNERANGAPPRRRIAVPAAGVTELAPVASGRSWPEGASGLGAVAREERQVWWEMPPPAWSPFQDGQATP